MIIKYLDNDGGNELHQEEVDNYQYVQTLLSALSTKGKINLRWPHNDSFFLGTFYEAIWDVEINTDGNQVEVLHLYFDLYAQR